MDSKSNNNLSPKYIIGIPIFTLIVLHSIGQYVPMVSILSTPIIISVAAALIPLLRVNIILRILLISLFIISNDFLLKTFVWGSYDLKGAGVFNFFTVISSIIAIIIVSISQYIKYKTFSIPSFLPILIIPFTLVTYINYAEFYGLTYTLNANKNRKSSIDKRVFMYDLSFSNKKIGVKNDSLEILSGWAEKRLTVDHNSFFTKDTLISGINYHISLNQPRTLTEPKFYYKINSEDRNGAKPIRDSILNISTLDSESVMITFFYNNWLNSQKNDSIVAKVHIKNR